MLLQQSENEQVSAKESNSIIDQEVKELKSLMDSTRQVADSVNQLQKNSEDIRNIL